MSPVEELREAARLMRERAEAGSVALAVADWPVLEASMVGRRDTSAEGHTFHALKVARAYLGGVR